MCVCVCLCVCVCVCECVCVFIYFLVLLSSLLFIIIITAGNILPLRCFRVQLYRRKRHVTGMADARDAGGAKEAD